MADTLSGEEIADLLRSDESAEESDLETVDETIPGARKVFKPPKKRYR